MPESLETNEKPTIAKKSPACVHLKLGEKYSYCTCGKSISQPFCDYSHIGGKFEPIHFHSQMEGEANLCMCKHSKNMPYCDGSHVQFQTKIHQKTTVPKAKTLSKEALTKVKDQPSVSTLPSWDDIQLLGAQFHTTPLPDSKEVKTATIIGAKSQKPIVLDSPFLIYSEENDPEDLIHACAMTAEMMGIGFAKKSISKELLSKSGCSTAFLEFDNTNENFDWNHVLHNQAFYTKRTQNQTSSIFNLKSSADYQKLNKKVKDLTQGTPTGFKIQAAHVEKDIQFAIEAHADFIILDCRESIGEEYSSYTIPIIPALARAKQFLTKLAKDDISLIVTLDTLFPDTVLKAIALGADVINIKSSTLSGYINQNGNSSTTTDNNAFLIKNQLSNLLQDMQKAARICGHDSLQKFVAGDLTTWNKEITSLTGIHYAGFRAR